MKKISFACVYSFLVLGLMSCSSSSDTFLRVLHASADQDPLDIRIDGSTAVSGLSFGEASDYFSVNASGSEVRALKTSNGDQVFNVDTDLSGSDYFTLAVANLSNASERIVLEDDIQTPESGKGRFRFWNGANSSTSLDVYITETGAVLADETRDFTSFQYKSVTDYVSLDAGQYQIRLTLVDTATLSLDETITIADGDNSTYVVLEASGGGEPYQLVKLSDSN